MEMGLWVSIGREKNEESVGYVVYKVYFLGSSIEVCYVFFDLWIVVYVVCFIFLVNSELSFFKVFEGFDYWLVNR